MAENTENKELTLKEKVRKLYKKVQEKKASIEAAQTAKFELDGQFRYGNTSAVIDIRSTTDISKLRDIVAFLLEKKAYTEAAEKELELETKPFNWFGASVQVWVSDIKIRVTQIQLQTRMAQLKQDENALLAMDPILLQEIRLEELENRIG